MKNAGAILPTVLAGLLSAGWTVPLALAIDFYFTSLHHAVSPQLNSFPALHYAEQSLWVATAWAFVVIAVWSAYLVRRFSR
ncbi:MAG TPA: hypothetical protein PKJ41_07620 [Bryobacteraceae bacterium]|nr:hypothetical protein [Bryobacteraceae bacterium]